jgi:hypothetical protein
MPSPKPNSYVFIIFRNILMLFALIIISTSAKAQLNDDWTEIQKVLADCVGIYSGVNNNIVTSGMPDRCSSEC